MDEEPIDTMMTKTCTNQTLWILGIMGRKEENMLFFKCHVPA